MTDGEEFAQLITLHQQRLHAHIFSLIGDSNAAWDVLQETNLILWAKRDEFQIGTNFRAWSHSFARFQVMAFLRDKSRERLSLLTPEILEKMEAEIPSEFEHYDKRLNALSACLQNLAPTATKLVQWHYKEQLSLLKISKRLSMSANAVKQALFRTRRSLQQCIESSVTSQ
ncbi:MAG: sigma-70 family RNA polymerase sigma factor [Akkermansiaceae bacterium]|jgi:RNA polymerase sigma-70 factor (ECF subfamily)